MKWTISTNDVSITNMCLIAVHWGYRLGYQLTFTCSILTTETLEKGVKYVYI